MVKKRKRERERSLFISSRIAGDSFFASDESSRDAANSYRDENNHDEDEDDEEEERTRKDRVSDRVERMSGTRETKPHDALYIPDSLLARTSTMMTRVPHYIHDGPPGTRHY